MLSWGLIYSLFSLAIVLLYSAIYYREKPITVVIKGKSKATYRLSNTLIFIIITFFSAFRLNVGSDYYNYYVYFNQIKEQYSSFRETLLQSQSGYWALSYIIKSLTGYQYAIFVVIAVFSYAFLFYLLRREVEDKPCALACYFFLGYYAYSNNILKQYIAMAFVMSAYLFFCRKDYIKCFICCILAIVFHYSAALVLVVIFFARKIEPSIKKYHASIIVGLGGAIVLNYLFTLFFHLIPSASGYEKYIDWRRSGQFRLVAAVVGMSIVYGILIFVIVRFKDKVKEVNEQRYKEIIFLLIGLCINIIAIRQWIINRIALYFYQFIILILPALFTGLDRKKSKRLKTILYGIMFLYMFFSSIFLGENEYYSYHMVFSGDQPISDVQYNIMHGWTKP